MQDYVAVSETDTGGLLTTCPLNKPQGPSALLPGHASLVSFTEDAFPLDMLPDDAREP